MSIKIKKYLILPLILFNLTSCSEDNVFFFCDLNADSGGNCFSDLDYPGKQANAIKFLKTDNGDNMDGYYVNIYIANTYYYHNRKENMVINYEDIEIGLYKKGDDECLKSYVIDADYFSSFENCIANKNEDAYNSNSIIESDFSIKYTFNLLEFLKMM